MEQRERGTSSRCPLAYPTTCLTVQLGGILAIGAVDPPGQADRRGHWKGCSEDKPKDGS